MMTTEEFWNQLGNFNATTWPVQSVWLVLMIAMLFALFAKRTSWVNAAIKILLSFAFAWNGILFFLVFSDGPVYDFFYAPLFILIALLFAIDILAKRIEFQLPAGGWQRYAALFLILLWLVYPFVGIALGRAFPRVCTPMNPCPSTVLAITLMVTAIPKIDKTVYILLLPWALLGLPKALGMYDCYEDCILFAAGVYGLMMLLVNWRAINQKIAA
jgi:hypothetical protein